MKLKEKFQRFWTLSKSREGFTLVELIVVIAILAILAGVAIPVYNGYIKKAQTAADQTLLDSVNTSFVAACMEEGISHYELTAAQAKMNLVLAENGGKKVDVSSVKPAAIQEAFAFYYEGNEASTFNTFQFLIYDQASGMFVAGQMSDLYANLMNDIIANNGDLIAAVQNSEFMNIGSEALLGQVTDVADLASSLIAGDSTLTGVVMDDAYLTSLATRLGKNTDTLKSELETMFAEDPSGAAQFLANSTVLNVAGTMNSDSFDESAALNKFATGDWGGLGTTLNTDPETGLAEVAMLYGLYTAYDSEAASELAMTGNVDALVALKDNAEFKAYLSEVNTEGSDAYKDYQGYKSALTIVNNSANDKEVANKILQGGYDDPELLAMLQGVLGG